MPKHSPILIRCMTSAAKLVASDKAECKRPTTGIFTQARASENFGVGLFPMEYLIYHEEKKDY